MCLIHPQFNTAENSLKNGGEKSVITAPCVPLSVSKSVSHSLLLPWLFLLCPRLSPSGSCFAISTKSEMFLLLMHTNAQPLTGADSMKREAAEINTYVMRGKRPPNGLPICVCQRLSWGCIDI